MSDLIDFLKSIILASTTIDKKYRETVPELVSHLRTLGDVLDHTETKRKSKKPKKIKLGSSGLYTDEDVHVRKWWAANKPAPRNDEILPRPEDVRYTISCLRTRETQLQIILILEIMALETMRHGIDAGESQLPGMAMELLDTPFKKVAPKKRNKLNLPLLIDVHADRLCIWQSTTSDDFRAQAESQILPASEPSAVQTAHADPLKEFCVDIILPFFSPRLPLVCDSLNRKLGGPVISASGSRSKRISSSTQLASNAKIHEKSSSLSAKSGAVKKRTSASTDKTRNLERVLTNERMRRSVSRGPNDAIAQMRCATAAVIPGLKRELSDTSLASIPRRASSTSTRDASAKSLSRSASEIIDSNSRTDQSHAARKKALVDAELQDAIDALKKPNRVLAGRATVEAAERRLFGVTAKKPKKQPSRPSPGTTVQVQATPTSNRVQDIFATSKMATFESQSAGHQLGRDPYRFPVKRELLGTGHSQQQPGLLPSSPMIMSTPSTDRVQATPAHIATSLAGFAATQLFEKFVTASSTAITNKTNATRYTLSRSSQLQPFSGEEESVPMSSPVAVRRTAPLFSQTLKSSGIDARPCQRLDVIAATELGNDMIPASSPLQARSQPVASVADSRRQAPLSTLAQPPSPSLTGVFDRRAAMFETPKKARPVSREDTAVMKREMGTPIAATPLAAYPAAGTGTLSYSRGGNSVLSLYQKMGWDDDLDELD
ncbi:hypothetical protein SEPCBS57363_002917 [Sporothrix epigloea]|uniref:DNA replication regulator Sld3 C-terminal domain-containing protein n=1 Tax=Sporothrix epigloea TaxID=1892477 RepID=A0ABP0DIK3_9PEZI